MRLEYFQLIDRIVDLDLAQQTICAEARVPSASTIFEGHFPGYPLMPGVLLIEAMAQTSGWLVIAVTRFSRMPFFAALKEAKLRSFVHPGESLSLSAKLLHEGSGYAVTRAEIRCGSKLACNAEITFRLVEFPNPEFRASMEKMAAILEFPIGALAQRFAPYLVHPLAPLDLDKQIPKKGDQRQMEPWQRIGTYAAGLALADAGVKGNSELLARMDMIVAAGGGERDVAVDAAILSNKRKSANPDAFLNERLMSDLRPTLFLAQLSNLLAGNVSIVHGVTGSSRTFMGEEAAGVDAVRIALARITAGQSELALVGGSHNGEREDLLLLYDAGGHMLRGRFARGVPRSGVARACTGAQRQAARAALAGAVGAISAPGRRNHGCTGAHVAKPRSAGATRTYCGDLRRNRRTAGDERGARMARDPTRRTGTGNGQLARTRV